jgi:stearoyl-CoA desaturase (delta-9 desaturase)
MKTSQPIWFIGFAHWLGIACIITGLALVIRGDVSAWWLLPWPFVHTFTGLMVTVGLHRYWSHRTFETTRFWRYVMALWPALVAQGSGMAWATAHLTHHIHSDKAGDPHYIKWDYLLWKRYNNVPMFMGRMKRLLADRPAVFAHRYGMVIWLAFSATLLLIDWKVFVYGYGMALGTVQVFGAIHQMTAHKNDEPRDLPLMEFLLPMFGEWNHKYHHDHPGRKDLRMAWWHIDIGYQFIRLIEIDKTKTTAGGSSA